MARSSKSHLLTSLTLVAILLCVSGCRGRLGQHFRAPEASTTQGSSAVSVTAQDQAQVVEAQRNQDRNVEVTVTAKVLKMLPEDTRGLPHEQFLLLLNNGTTVKVAHDTKMAPRVPLEAGDVVCIHGEYIWNEKGGVIHWTHHAAGGRHEGGWIDFNGMRYQ